jgi:hypothetical protein
MNKKNTISKQLREIEKLLESVLMPAKRAPYISSDEIDLNDQKIKKALLIIRQIKLDD